MSLGNCDILLVEDSPADVRLTQEAFREGKIEARLHVVKDGVEAMSYLYKRAPYAGAVRPDLIFLDLNMPRKNGREVLAEIKANENLKTIPVVILTTSSAQEDIIDTYSLHCNCYVVKPVDLEEFNRVISVIDGFWMKCASLPTA